MDLSDFLSLGRLLLAEVGLCAKHHISNLTTLTEADVEEATLA